MANDFKIKNGLQLGGAFVEKVGTISGNADVDLSTGNVFSYTPTADATFAFNNAGETEHSFVLSVTGADVAVGYDLASAAYDSVSFSVAAQNPIPLGMSFNNNGTKLFIVTGSTDSVNQYTLSSAYDITTLSYDSIGFSTASQDSFPRGVQFNTDGTKMYILGPQTLSIFEYNLSAGFDLTTASYGGVSFSVSPQTAAPQNFKISNNGSKLHVVEANADTVLQYTLSTPYNLSTASYDDISFSIAGQAAIPSAIEFNSAGTIMFIVDLDGDSIFQYNLSSPFNVSTATYSSVSFSVASQESNPHAIAFNANGTKLFMTGYTNDTIYQYSTAGTPAPATFTYPASVAWPSGTAPDAPAVGETDILEFSTTDGGTTWYGVRTGDAMA